MPQSSARPAAREDSINNPTRGMVRRAPWRFKTRQLSACGWLVRMPGLERLLESDLIENPSGTEMGLLLGMGNLFMFTSCTERRRSSPRCLRMGFEAPASMERYAFAMMGRRLLTGSSRCAGTARHLLSKNRLLCPSGAGPTLTELNERWIGSSAGLRSNGHDG